MEIFIEKTLLKGTRFEKLNNEIDYSGKDGTPLRLTVLAGINGSGKTNLLSIIYREADKIHSLKNELNEEYKEKLRPPYKLNYFGGFNGKIKKYIDKIIYEKGLTKDNAIEDINNKIFTLIPNFKIQIDSFSVRSHFDIIFKNEFGDKFKEAELASGESTLLGSIFSLYFEEVKNKLILIDEPEYSLHPSWQSKVVQLYENYAKQNNCQVIMATHSPFILSAVKSEQIRLLKKTPEGIKIEKIAEEINGWTIERILQYFMETEHVRDPKTAKEIADLFEMMKSGKHKNGAFNERFASLEERLGYEDNDMTSLRMQLDYLKKNENN